MAVPFEKIVAEDLHTGPPGTTVSVTMPAGGSALGTPINVATFVPKVYNVYDYGAKGDGVTDDTAAINACCAAALAATDQTSSDFGGHPPDQVGGSVMVLAVGIFKISAQITCSVHFDGSRASFLVYNTPAIAFLWQPAAGSGPNSVINGKRLIAPELIAEPQVAPPNNVGVGLQIVNAQNCEIHVRKVQAFQKGIVCRGDGDGFAWNHTKLRWIENNSYGLWLDAINGGYCNENTFYGGNFGITPGANIAGTAYIRIDDNGRGNNNVFIHPALELDGPQYHYYCAGRFNLLWWPRFEDSSAQSRVLYADPNNDASGGIDNMIVIGYPPFVGDGFPVITLTGQAGRNSLEGPYLTQGGGRRIEGGRFFGYINSLQSTLVIPNGGKYVGIGDSAPTELLSMKALDSHGVNIAFGYYSHIGITASQIGLLLGYNAKADSSSATGNQAVAASTDAGGYDMIRMSQADGGIAFYANSSGVTAGDVLPKLAADLIMKIRSIGLIMSSRLQQSKGAIAASANVLTLTGDGNMFHVSGNTQINGILPTNWQAGSHVTLIFDSNPLVKHNTGGGGSAAIFFKGAADVTMAANKTLRLAYDGSLWYEI
jgi:hypothetical protein